MKTAGRVRNLVFGAELPPKNTLVCGDLLLSPGFLAITY